MSGMLVNLDKCVGCGLCAKACPQGAIRIENKKAVITADCTVCGLCRDACRMSALYREEKESGLDLSAYSGVMVFAERDGEKVLDVAFELLGVGRELARDRGCVLSALLLGGEEMESEARDLIAAGADRVYLMRHPRFRGREDMAFAAAVSAAVERLKPEILLFGATGFGRSVAPRVAARLRTGLTADCTELRIAPDTGLMEQTRPAFGGNLMATIVCPGARPQMATVRPGVMAALPRDSARVGEIHQLSAPSLPALRVSSEQAVRKVAEAGIEKARIIVSAGSGIGKQKNMELVQELCRLLDAELGVSRPLVDAGWSTYEHQIGQTGRSIAPDLLITFGVSGAVQHLAGIANAQTVMAVNIDPDAPIFSVADYAVVADATEILTAMIAELKNKYPAGLAGMV